MKEKYITIQHHNGKDYITVKFKYEVGGIEKTYSKTFNPSEYHTFNECLIAACNHRDIKRAELLTCGLPNGVHRTVAEVFIEEHEQYHECQGNIRSLEVYYNTQIKEQFGNRYIDDIKPMEIQSCLDGLRYKYSLNAIRRVAVVWKKIFKTALIRNYISINPMDRVIVPSKSKKIVIPKDQSVDDSAIDKMLEYYADSGRNDKERYNNRLMYYLIIIMKETGMRPAECYALQRKNTHLEERYIEVSCSLGSDEESSEVIVTTKNDNSIRKVPLNDIAIEAIKELIGFAKSDILFANYDGELLVSRKVACRICLRAKVLGVKFNLYMLRHRFSTNLNDNNVDIRTIMDLMGHAKPDMTILYARSTDEKKENAIKKLS